MSIQSDHKDVRELIMGDLTQFHIPIYQRSYTWEAKKQVEKFLNDIIEFGSEYKDNNRADYYIGNIIVKNQTRGFLTERLVIDGQQRITTVILTLCAIRDICLDKIKSDEAKLIAANINDSLYKKENEKIKLKLNNMEHQSSLEAILTGSLETITPENKKTNYWKTYKYLYNRLVKLQDDEFFDFTRLLERVKAVIIFLDNDQDENSVFESINSLGKPLSGSDLIKNFLFTFKYFECSREQEKLLTDLYTKKFELLFKNEKCLEAELERFFREYIAIHTHALVNKDPKAIYYSFKNLIGEIDSFQRCKQVILDVVKWGLIYQSLRVEGINEIKHEYLEYLRASFGTYACLLMDIVEKNSNIEDGELVINNADSINDAFKRVVTYDASRFLAGYPAKEITRFIPTIPDKLNKLNDKYFLDYAASFEQLVTSTNDGYRQPSLNVLKRSIVTVDLYSRQNKPLLRLFMLLENINKKELLSFEKDLKNCQIEHIMPQTPNDKWSYIPKETHEKYVHTLGNLSITFNNQNLSNKGFSEKKKILSELSKINLNKILLDYDIFDVNAIEDRANKLMNLFLSKFDVKEPSVPVDNSITNTIYMNHNGVSAEGVLKENGIIIKEGSEVIVKNKGSLSPSLVLLKEKYIEDGILEDVEGTLVFTQDVLFSSPSQAASLIGGSSLNGKDKWKRFDGKSLNELGY